MSRIDPIEFKAPDGRVVVIRVFAESDAEALLACVKAEAMASEHIYIERDEIEAEYSVEREREQIVERLDADGVLALGVFPLGDDRAETGECVGSLTFKAPGNRKRARHRGMFGVAVLPAWQGLGIGTAMIDAMLAWARAHPFVEVVSLGCYHTNVRALKLYKEMGFVEEGRGVDFFRYVEPDGSVGYADDVQMVLRVKPRGHKPPASE